MFVSCNLMDRERWVAVWGWILSTGWC